MLSDTRARQTRPTEKPQKLHDHGGLYLFVSPYGSKSWRYDYRNQASRRRETLTLGRYPETTLAEARALHAEARRKVSRGESPAKQKRAGKRVAVDSGTFRAIADSWYDAKAPHLSESWRTSTRAWLDKKLYPVIGARRMGDITPADILSIMKGLEARGHSRTASCLRQLASQVFQHAIRNLQASYDPAQSLKGALIMPPVQHRAPLPARDIPAFIEALDAYRGTLQTKFCIKLLLLTFVRKLELVQAAWNEIDFEKAEWRIPAERMKMKDPHVVPLARQALECFQTLKDMACGSRYVFAQLWSLHKPMSGTTLNKAFSGMGYAGKFTPHGLRSTACSALNEMGFKPDVIERQLAHVERNRIRAAYNHAEYLPERREMLQFWADHLDGLTAGNNGAP